MKSSLMSLMGSVMTAILLTACGGGEQPEKTLISAVRTSPVGTQAEVEGLVTVPSGRFNSSTGDLGFAIQDGSGGVYVTTQATTDLPLGAWVRFDAELKVVSTQVMLTPIGAIERLAGSALVEPLDLATGSVDDDAGGRLVRVSGRVTRAVVTDLPYGHLAFIDDGSGEVKVFINIASGLPVIELAALTVGADVQVTGFVYKYDDVLEVSPRQATDLVVR
jgi:hypothetical protein